MSRRQKPVGRCAKCAAPAHSTARIGQACGKTMDGKVCRAVIGSTLNETDWTECPACTGYGLTADKVREATVSDGCLRDDSRQSGTRRKQMRLTTPRPIFKVDPLCLSTLSNHAERRRAACPSPAKCREHNRPVNRRTLLAGVKSMSGGCLKMAAVLPEKPRSL